MKTVDVGVMLDEGPWRGYQKLLVFVTALAIVLDGVDNQLLSVAIPALMREWTLPRAPFTHVVAIGLVGMMIGGAIAGVLGDRYGRRKALLGSVFVFGVVTSTIVFVDSIWALGALRFLSGLGLGGAMPNAATLASEFVPRRYRPFAVTLTIVCIPLGGTLAGSVAIRVLPALGWRTLFLLGGIAPFVVAVLLVALLPESPRFLARRPERWPQLQRILQRFGHSLETDAAFTDIPEKSISHASAGTLFEKDFRRDTIALWVAFFSCLFAVYLGLNWVPSMLTGAGLSSAVGSAGITAFNLGGVAGAVAGALAFTRFGSRATMLTMAAGAIVGALVIRSMTIGPGSATAPIIAMLGITGGLINAVQTTMYGLAAHIYPTAIRATGVGTSNAIGRSGAILSSYAGAWALAAGGSALLFALIAMAMLVSSIGLAVIRRHISLNKCEPAIDGGLPEFSTWRKL
jgi:AAHS family 4-hydroxybenzoate transporter-like MFS transporter